MAEKECPKCPPEGLPPWMGTFADMMTLLMCFFVLLFAMSSLDPVKIQMMQDSAQKRLGIKQDSSTQIKKRPLDNELNIRKKLKKIVEEMEGILKKIINGFSLEKGCSLEDIYDDPGTEETGIVEKELKKMGYV